MGRYVNPGNEGFTRILEGEYVDKTGLVSLFDSTLNTARGLVMVSRPRRFGKSFAAQSIVAFYSRGCDSRALFEGLEVSRREGWDEHLNAYNVLQLDMAEVMQSTAGTDAVSAVAGKVLPELRALVPNAGSGAVSRKSEVADALWDYVMGEAIQQEQAGAQVLDVNAGLPEIDERATLVRLVEDLQGVTTLPLQIDSADPCAIEAAVRIYPGKAIINSTNGKREVLDAVLPIAKRYGCAIVGLALDEEGIPATAEGRLGVARKIVAACDELGIPGQDVLIDCLTMAVSTNQEAARTILDAIRLVKRELPGVRTVLGVSNISFGLPYRELLNATFLTAAFEAGLDLAIMNPLSQRFMDAVGAWRVFNGEDVRAERYIAANAGRTDARGGQVSADKAQGGQAPTDKTDEGGVDTAVLEGRGELVAQRVRELLNAGADPLDVVNNTLIPALDEVGKRFERGAFFLPQLMASAEAAKAGFAVVREASSAQDVATKGEVALATVKGDIHDIGKNIVKMLLENYGYEVRDLGRDVDPQTFVDEVVRHHIRLAGLSALMTTTVPAMAQTIELLREQAPWCKVMVGGAVLNPEYARMVGADFYAKDASESARIAAEVLG